MQTYTHHAFGHPCTDIFKVSIMLKFNSFHIFYLHRLWLYLFGGWSTSDKWFPARSYFHWTFWPSMQPSTASRKNTGTSHWSCFLDAFTSRLSDLGFASQPNQPINNRNKTDATVSFRFSSGNPLNSLRKLRQDVWSKEKTFKSKV